MNIYLKTFVFFRVINCGVEKAISSESSTSSSQSVLTEETQETSACSYPLVTYSLSVLNNALEFYQNPSDFAEKFKKSKNYVSRKFCQDLKSLRCKIKERQKEILLYQLCDPRIWKWMEERREELGIPTEENFLEKWRELFTTGYELIFSPREKGDIGKCFWKLRTNIIKHEMPVSKETRDQLDEFYYKAIREVLKNEEYSLISDIRNIIPSFEIKSMGIRHNFTYGCGKKRICKKPSASIQSLTEYMQLIQNEIAKKTLVENPLTQGDIRGEAASLDFTYFGGPLELSEFARESEEEDEEKQIDVQLSEDGNTPTEKTTKKDGQE